MRGSASRNRGSTSAGIGGQLGQEYSVTAKLSLSQYDHFVRTKLRAKIPKWLNKDFRLRMGDCIYDYSTGKQPHQRNGVHPIDLMPKDLRGVNSLLSRHFYYFGEEPRRLPDDLKKIIRRGRKHLVFDDAATIERFERWIGQFRKNKIYADPQLRYEFDLSRSKSAKLCSTTSNNKC